MFFTIRTRLSVFFPLIAATFHVTADAPNDHQLDFSQLTQALCQQLSHPEAPRVAAPVCGGKRNMFGGSLAISYKGEIIFEQAMGAATFDGSEIVDRGSLFRVASLHKPITAIGVMRLVQDGKLELEDPVFGTDDSEGPTGVIGDEEVIRYIRQGSKVLDITVDHLLKHASGWPKYSGYAPFALRQKWRIFPKGIAEEYADTGRPGVDTLVKFMADLEPAHAPGTYYQYNNMNYVVLNKVMEAAAGMPYDQYFKHYIFEPLNIQGIKPARTFRGDRYQNEVEYLWPSLDDPNNQREQYCTGELAPTQYGLFPLEDNWVATPRALIKLFDAIDEETSQHRVLAKQTIVTMFETERISGTTVARGWANVNSTNANAGDWSFTGGTAGTAARFVKTGDGFKIAYLRNSSPSHEEKQRHKSSGASAEEAYEQQWSARWITEVALREARKQSSKALEDAPAVPAVQSTRAWNNAPWTASQLQVGCRHHKS